MCLESSKLHDIKKWNSEVQNNKFKRKNHLKILSKYFAENGNEKLFSNESSF